MRVLVGFILVSGLLWATAGCGFGPKPYYDGAKIEAFSGQVVQDGKPVTFSEDEEVVIKFIVAEGDDAGKRFGVGIKPDGSFGIGWMPLGKMQMIMERSAKDPARRSPGPPNMYTIPGTLTTEKGKTSGYEIELGKAWKPNAQPKDIRPKGKGGKT
jgi:hypothetical protein